MFDRRRSSAVVWGAIMTAGIVSLGGCYSYGYPDDRMVAGPVVAAQPPAPLVEEAPAEPFSDALWVSGFWRWGGMRYAWVHGYYVRPRPGLFWYPGGWMTHGDGFVWFGGRWAPRSYMGTYQRRYRHRFIYRGHPAYRHYRRHPTRRGVRTQNRYSRRSKGVRRPGKQVRRRRQSRKAVRRVSRVRRRAPRVQAARPQHPRKKK